MIKLFKYTLLGLGLSAGMTVAQDSAAAYTYPSGFICEVDLTAAGQGTSYGTAGYLWASIYTQPGCTGTSVASGFFCSSGATACPAVMRFTEGGLLATYASLHESMNTGNKVWFMKDGSFIAAIWTLH